MSRIVSRSGSSPELISAAQGSIEKQIRKEQAFSDFLETAPNLNSDFMTEITAIEDIFREDGFTISPIYILSADVYEQAIEIAGGDSPHNNGINLLGKSLIRVTPEVLKQHGGNYILATGIHESAHGTADTGEDITVVKRAAVTIGSTAMEMSIDFVLNNSNDANFTKYKWEPDNEVFRLWKIKDSFLEEGFADSLRIKYIEQLKGLPNTIGSPLRLETQNGVGVRYVTPDGSEPVIFDENTVNIPISVVGCITPDSKGTANIKATIPELAAYSVQLLDNQVPGLFDAMKASRKDATRQRDVIRMIDSVKPGLYRELRELTYSAEDFIRGLQIVATALTEATGNETRVV